MKHLCLVLACVCACAASSAQETFKTATLREHIAFDAGVWLPFGDAATKLDLEPAFGFNVHFWKSFSDYAFVVGSVGNGWFNMGTNVQTDTGIIDGSGYQVTASPLLGGVGYLFPLGEVVAIHLVGHAGVTIIGITEGARKPATYLNDNAYFTAAATLGSSFRLSEKVAILLNTRYVKMFGDDLQHFDVAAGMSFRW